MPARWAISDWLVPLSIRDWIAERIWAESGGVVLGIVGYWLMALFLLRIARITLQRFATSS